MHLLTQSFLLKALGWSLFNSFWQMGLLWMFYHAVTGFFQNASIRFRHDMALMLLGSGAVWSGLSFLFTYFSGEAGQPSGFFLFTGGMHPGLPFLERSRQWIGEVVPYGSSLYLLALSLLLARYTNHYLHSRRLKGTDLSKIQPGFRVYVSETSQLLGIRKKVSVWLSSRVNVPLTLGFFKPVILLPVAMVANLTISQVEAILLHEMAHIRRNDYLLNLAMTLIEILFFFNPFSRLLIRVIKREREHRCDDLVLQFRYDPRTYVSALLSIATGNSSGQHLALAATGGNDQLLLQRVRRILQQKNAKERPGAKPVILLIVSMIAVFLTLSRSPYSPVPSSHGFVQPASPNTLASEGPSMGGLLPAGQPFLRAAEQSSVFHTPKTPPPDLPAADPSTSHRQMVFPRIESQSGEDPEDNRDLIVIANQEGPEIREYSMAAAPAAAPELRTGDKQEDEQLPFVPSSSFSYQVVEDTLFPGEQRAGAGSVGRQAVVSLAMAEVSMKKMEKQLQGQWKALQQAEELQKTRILQQAQALQQSIASLQSQAASALEAQRREGIVWLHSQQSLSNHRLQSLSATQIDVLKTQKLIFDEQLKLQRQYLQKQQELEKKLEKTRRRVIVYI
jgi:Zn-dependent protease with chaperone function